MVKTPCFPFHFDLFYIMPVPAIYKANFHEDQIYHVFNQTNNLEKMFLSDQNCHFFLRKYEEYLAPLMKTYSWTLLPDHFHSLVEIKNNSLITEWFDTK